jgi:hypothetical protein
MSLSVLKTLGAYRTSSTFDIGHLFACGRAPGTNQQYNVNEAETKPLSSSEDLIRSREARHMHDHCLGAGG